MQRDQDIRLKFLAKLLGQDVEKLQFFPEELRNLVFDDIRKTVSPFVERASDLIENGHPPLPDRAPLSWSSIRARAGDNPAEFIRRVYASWIGKGLRRSDFLWLDRPLYIAYSKWASRKGDDPTLCLATGYPAEQPGSGIANKNVATRKPVPQP